MSQKGFSGLFIIIIVAIAASVGASSFYFLNHDEFELEGEITRNADAPLPVEPGDKNETPANVSMPVSEMENVRAVAAKEETPPPSLIVTKEEIPSLLPHSPLPQQEQAMPAVSSPAETHWRLGATGWEPVGTPPQCPEPFHIVPPIDIQLATSVLYPGQIRNGNSYEPGGGFRFDKSPTDVITVRAPADAVVVGGARFLVQGEIQYVFDLITPCGIMFRYDHLLSLSPEFQKIADNFAPPKENDSRTTFLSPSVPVAASSIIATAVGLRNNNFISWSVFDLRQKNASSQDPLWAAEHPTLEHYAVCPYDFLSPDIQKIIYSLPATDSTSGSKSDFCN